MVLGHRGYLKGKRAICFPGFEGELEGARRYYNGVVKSFNTKLEVFPSNLVANGMGEDYKKRAYFELTSTDARQNVKVQF